MKNYFRQRYREFAQHPVGERFRRRFERTHQSRKGWLNKMITVLVSAVLLLAGVLMLITPGPGLAALLLGGILLAQESLTAARFMDWCDLRVRAAMKRLKKP